MRPGVFRRDLPSLVITFYDSAWQSLGKVMSPVTGEVERNLEAARHYIDMLDMIRRKTNGNLNVEESRFIEHVLYQLRMDYVEVARGAPEGEEASGRAAPSGGEAPSNEGGGRADAGGGEGDSGPEGPEGPGADR